MKDRLKKMIEDVIALRWSEEYELIDVIQHQYGFSPIFKNKKNSNRFSPTLFQNQMVHRLTSESSPEIQRAFEKEIETAFEKEKISG